tara:strand:+ start:4942 stop:6318 length:1377 start_codon:yes stop_codon:yes gene_type:complete
MGYNGNNTGTTVYLLSTGEIWEGEVHQMEGGEWMTETQHSLLSEPLLLVQETPEYPGEGLVGKAAVFKQVFSSSKASALSDEGLATGVLSKLKSFSSLLDTLSTTLTVSLAGIESFITRTTTQDESNGAGKIIDGNLNFKLPIEAAEDLTSAISTIEYIPNSSAPTYIFNGDVVSGAPNQGLIDSKNSSITIDLVSRTGAELVNTLSDFLIVPADTQPGFDGKIVLTLSGQTPFTYLDVPTNASIISMSAGENIIDPSGLFSPIISDKIEINISRIAPIPFWSYFSNENDDLLGNPEDGQILLDDQIYQRTTLELGQIKLASTVYEAEKEFERGPYTCRDGYLKSIYFAANETVPIALIGEVDALFRYTLIIDNKELPIRPSNREGGNPRIYYVNSTLSESARETMRNSGAEFVDSATPQINWKLKIKLMRPESQYLTPSLQGVTFTYSTNLDGDLNG